MAGEVEIRAVTPERWLDLVDLFERPGPRGAWSRTAACYCMFWRLPPAEYEDGFRNRSLTAVGGGPNKDAMAGIVASGATPGLLAFRDGVPVGWVSITPRHDLSRLDHVPAPGSQKHPGDERTWSVSCFYVHRSAGRGGIGGLLLDAAVEHAATHGASGVDGYPVKQGSVDPYTGYATMFQRAGFRLLQPGRGKGRALWRKDLRG